MNQIQIQEALGNVAFREIDGKPCWCLDVPGDRHQPYCEAATEALTALRTGKLVVVDGERLDLVAQSSFCLKAMNVHDCPREYEPDLDDCRECIKAYLQRKDSE